MAKHMKRPSILSALTSAAFVIGASIIIAIASDICSCDAFSDAGRQSVMLAPSSSTLLTSSYSKTINQYHRRNRLSTTPTLPYFFMSSSTQNNDGNNNNNDNDNKGDDDAMATIINNGITREAQELSQCTSIVYNYLSKPDGDVSATDVVQACDAVDEAVTTLSLSSTSSNSLPMSISYLNQYLSLRRRSHEFGRYHLLVKLLRSNYDAYVSTAEFLSPSRIKRMDLPNVQDVKYYAAINNDDDANANTSADKTAVVVAKMEGVGVVADAESEVPLVPDCTLQNMTYNTSPLDALLLSIFRKFVSEYTQMPMRDDIPGIQGLVVQGRSYMTKDLPEGTSYAEHAYVQHDMVKTVLGRLMTPVLPPFYRIFMSGIVPSNNNLPESIQGKQLGPWFYAPYLTSIVTPIFFGFLVGPSHPNRRKDGQRGGLVVEKCKFLQESQCKGLCLHQCKLPAQEFFKETLGLELSVSPNFVTQECQWSFGERPLEVREDSSFPVGCLVGCESRKGMAAKKRGDDICM
ncbi:hypothetical protein ACHAWU_008938 [Discostella pseudostelligera]|uniref:Beta-carotene isomerase D27-like C-terminal domain-containing protein n=1 Tax=Discostella pseudostelligera TaxID=259834 RepID=A0ABD3MKD7_9STRA